LDIAKNVFQVHGIDASEKVVVRKRLRRSQVLEFRSRPNGCHGLEPLCCRWPDYVALSDKGRSR
jgi:hypothetical protein